MSPVRSAREPGDPSCGDAEPRRHHGSDPRADRGSLPRRGLVSAYRNPVIPASTPIRASWCSTPRVRRGRAPGCSTRRRRTCCRARRTWYLLIAEGGTERGPRGVDRARSDARADRGSRARTIRSSAIAAPTGRSRTPATAIWSRRPTARGGWCCTVPGRRGIDAQLPRPRAGDVPRLRWSGSTTGPLSVSSHSRWTDAAGRDDPAVPRRRETTSTGHVGPALARHPFAARRQVRRSRSVAGWLTLHGTDASLEDDEPAFVGRRQQHPQCRVRVLVDAGSAAEAGLTV